MTTLRRINQKKVTPMKFKDEKPEDNRPVKGAELFDKLCCNIFICAPTTGGKTTLALDIIKECTTKKTTVIHFCPEIYTDQKQKRIKKYCKLKGIPYQAYMSLYEKDDQGNKVNILRDMTMELKQKKNDDEDEDNENDGDDVQRNLAELFNNDEDDEDDDMESKKYRAPEYLFYFDDIGHELRDPVIYEFIKASRHSKCKVIFSSQDAKDLVPKSIGQLKYCILFSKLCDDAIEHIYKRTGNIIDLDTFTKQYKIATQNGKYSFFYIDVDNHKYRQNFDFEFDNDEFN